MSGCEATPEVKAIIRAMAKAKLEEGITDHNDIVDSIHEAINEHTPLWKNEIADIISGYGQKPSRQATKSELQERVLQLKRDLKAAHHPPAPKPTPEERSNTTRQAAIKKAQEATDAKIEAIKKELNDKTSKLRAGDFAAARREPKVYDDTTQKMQRDLDVSKRHADNLLRKLDYQNKSRAAKVADTFLAFHRAMILSGLGTIEHLTGASLGRLIFSPIEQAMGGLLHMVPGIRGISDKALTEGGGFQPGAVAAGYRAALGPKTLKDMANKVARGFSDLQAQHKDPYYTDHPLLDLVGHIHDALKTPAENYAYTKSLVTQASQTRKQLAREGMSPSDIDKAMVDPSMVARSQAIAYGEALRAKLQGDNLITDKYRQLVAGFENAKTKSGKPIKAGPVIAGVLNYVFPIVKIPVNLANEVAEYATGSLQAAAIGAAHRGNIDAEIADAMMRKLKKGSLGIVLGIIAWLGYKAFGGEYDETHHSEPGSPDYGDLRIAGHDIPKQLLHSPAFTYMQSVATARRVFEQELSRASRKSEGHVSTGDQANAGVTSAMHGALATLNTIPFIEQPKEFYEAAQSADKASDLIGREVSENIPQALKDVSKWTDPENALKRKPVGAVQQVENAIPGLRENVPLQGLKHMSLDDKIAAYEKMTPAERDKTDILDSINTSAEHSRTITPEQQKRLDAINQ